MEIAIEEPEDKVQEYMNEVFIKWNSHPSVDEILKQGEKFNKYSIIFNECYKMSIKLASAKEEIDKSDIEV